MNRISIVSIIIVTSLPYLYCYASETIKPHSAITNAEISLERSINITIPDDYVIENIFQLKSVKYDKKINYKKYLTNGVINSIRSEEKWQLDKYCNGKYIDGEICGLDYNPITCANDFTDESYYFTVKQTKNTAEILHAWYKTDPVSEMPRYFMVRENGVWKIDGIVCGPYEHQKFNVKK